MTGRLFVGASLRSRGYYLSHPYNRRLSKAVEQLQQKLISNGINLGMQVMPV